MKTVDKVKEIVSEGLGISIKEITDCGNLFEEYGADSLDIVEIVMVLEEDFKIEIPDCKAENFKTVNDIVKFVNGKQGKGIEENR